MRAYIFILLTLLLAMPALTMPAHAQSKKELAAQNVALTQRLARLENRMLTGDPAAERLMQRVDALEASQRTLTGEVERLRFERDNLRAELSAVNETVIELEALSARTKFHLDAVDMMGNQGQGLPPSGAYGGPQYQTPQNQAQNGGQYIYDGAPNNGLAGQPSAIPGPPTLTEKTIPVQENYPGLALLPGAGKTKLAEGDFAGAQVDFKTYLAAMPDAPDAGEVNFWLGETYYVRQGYADAADAYIASMRKAPNGIKAPDAMVRLAAALRGLGQKDKACQTLDSFPSQYPNAPASVREKARTELSRSGC
ncbi:MAG: tol-pal system protein YbgF [Alphaproteobacteria bacterium]